MIVPPPPLPCPTAPQLILLDGGGELRRQRPYHTLAGERPGADQSRVDRQIKFVSFWTSAGNPSSNSASVITLTVCDSSSIISKV
jgi:hypothetical protein